MIPRDFLTHWSAHAPWTTIEQVEQDLVITRALVAIFRDPELSETLVFRGGTALAKLHFDPPHRYSEDIDLVQRNAAPIGPTLDRLRAVMDPWLGNGKHVLKEGRVVLKYRFRSEGTPPRPLRLKVEINSREHFAVFPAERPRFGCESPWFDGECDVTTFALDELLATKFRALYQRRKGRDLYDLGRALRETDAEPERIIEAFERYMSFGGHAVTRMIFEDNLAAKVADRRFTDDVRPLLATGRTWDPIADAGLITASLIDRLTGGASS